MRNPLSIFKLVQRVANFLKNTKGEHEGVLSTFLVSYLVKSMVNKLRNHHVCSLVKTKGLPLTEIAEEFVEGNAFIEDLAEVADAILRIHFIYGLNVTEVKSCSLFMLFTCKSQNFWF